MPTLNAPVIEKETVTVNKTYPNYNVIMLNSDDIDALYVVECLCKVIPKMTTDKAFSLTLKIHTEQSGIVWSGPLEIAELYREQLISLGMVMAPLEKCGS